MNLLRMDIKKMSAAERIKLLVKAIDGSQQANESLSKCKDGEEMIDILLNASSRLNLDLNREDLISTPPIRDWIWWKNKEALLTLGSGTPRHQQDTSKRTRWDNWSLRLFDVFKKKK